MKKAKRALLIAAAAIWGVLWVVATAKLYTTWRNTYRSPDTPLYPTELVYKIIDGRNIRLDVYRPHDTLATHKTIIYIHGGSWISGTKRKIQDFYRYNTIKTLLNNNIEIVSIDYSLIARHANTLENCIYDARDAIKYCFDNASYLGIDTAHVGLWGSSAGVHLAMMSYIQLPNPENIKFIIDDFGPTDISEMWSVAPDCLRRLVSSVFFRMRYRDLKRFDILTKAFSPLYYTQRLAHVPILVSHGDKDPIVNPRQSIWLHDSLPQTSDLFIYPGLKHGFKTMDSTEIKHYTKRVMEFVGKEM